MRIAVPREVLTNETRVALVPETVKKLVAAGIEIAVERDAGAGAFISDAAFRDAGARIEDDVAALLSSADLVLKVQPPRDHPTAGKHEVQMLREGAMLLSTLYPTRNPEVVRRLAERNVTAFATDCIPRITRAQSMDTLSSMANIAGYKAVLLAADRLGQYFPMLMTAAGTVKPARVFVIGAGVAGLQAIATAKRLGAVIEGTDTRPVVREQIESLGARWVGVDTSDAAQDAGGYAKEQSADFYRKQSELLDKHCATADVVITTALIGGVKAPRLISAEMVSHMRPGSILVDLAAEGGGNCECTEPDRVVVKNGVTILGPTNLPAELPVHASMLFSRNLTTFVLAFWKDGAFKLDLNDDILKGATVTHGGQIMHAGAREALGLGGTAAR